MKSVKNFILIVLDSLRQDHVSFYNKGEPRFRGVKACSTPNLDKFAKKSVVFRNAYPGCLPTIPVRTEWLTGRFILPHRGWRPLDKYPEDIALQDVLVREGYKTALITDTYHLFKPEMNFHRNFHSFQWIRGQEYDAYRSNKPVKRRIEDYVNKNYPEQWRRRVSQYLSNTEDFREMEDYFPARVFTAAIEWLRRNVGEEKPFFLWIDSFDPHEPWDPHPEFDKYTDPNYEGPRLIMPMGGWAREWASEEEIRYIRGLYAGEVAQVDYWFGIFMEEVEKLGILDDTAILLSADHGHPLADHGKFLKGRDRLYNELLKVPFMIRHPELEHSVVDSIITFADVAPTVLEILGLGNNTYFMGGKSFIHILEDPNAEGRESVIMGYFDPIDRCIRNREWTLIIRPEGMPDELYNLQEDPYEKKNLIDERRDIAVSLLGRFGKYFFREKVSVKGIQEKYETEYTAV